MPWRPYYFGGSGERAGEEAQGCNIIRVLGLGRKSEIGHENLDNEIRLPWVTSEHMAGPPNL